MKKLLLIFLLCVLVQNVSIAKDYTKLHIKEMQKSQKYSTSKNFFNNQTEEKTLLNAINLKDPKLIKLSGYEEISEIDYKNKLAKDEFEYQKISKYLAKKKSGDYRTFIYSEDFYKIYRIAEKIIRANKLDFINWRIQIIPESSFNAMSSETNCITIYTGALDTLIDNENALALLIGHELAHSLLGHSARSNELYAKLIKMYNISYATRNNLTFYTARKKLLNEYRKMEYAADVEGAKLALKAGYNLDEAKETLSFINTMGNPPDWNSSHPKPINRLKNYNENRKYFFDEEWIKQGRFNIYNSDVLECKKSSKKNSLTILRNEKLNENYYYQPENLSELYLRFGYKAYQNMELKQAIKYFKKYLNLEKDNYAVYLYLSYAYENLYNITNKKSCLTKAINYANSAFNITPDNKYTKKQIIELEKLNSDLNNNNS